MIYDLTKTCAFTGHRVLDKDFNKREVELVVNKLIKEGFDTFLIGMALGFDTEAFHILEKIKKKKNIKIVACVPCLDQSLKFNEKQKKEYEKMLLSADEKIIISEKYFPGCMAKRNRYMVDNSSALVAYLNTSKGGTYTTVAYASKKEKRIIYVNKEK